MNASIQLFQKKFGCARRAAVKLGYTAYTNVAGNKETVVQGTTLVWLSFLKLYYAASKVKCHTEYRGGVFDFLVFPEGILLCVLNPEHVRYALRILFPMWMRRKCIMRLAGWLTLLSILRTACKESWRMCVRYGQCRRKEPHGKILTRSKRVSFEDECVLAIVYKGSNDINA